MNATQMAMNYVRFQWQAAGKVVSLADYRARRWLAKHTRPIPQKDPPEAA